MSTNSDVFMEAHHSILSYIYHKTKMEFNDTLFTTTTLMPEIDLNETTKGDYLGALNTESLQMTRYVVHRILTPIVVMLGMVGNIMSIIVLTHRTMKSSTNTYLAALAVSDTLYLVTSFTLSYQHYDDLGDSRVYKYWYVAGRILTDLWGNVSVCLTVTFTIERYIAVCHPMKGRVICTPQRARIIAIIVSLFALISVSPEFFEWKIVERCHNNVTTFEIGTTAFGESPEYNVGYFWYIVVMFTFVPLLSIWTFNWILIRSVCKATKLRKSMTYVAVKRPGERQQGEQNRITMMLISVAVVFLICQSPAAGMLMYKIYLGLAEINLTVEEKNELRIAGNVTNLLLQINAAINFILYSVMSTKFRKIYSRMFCRRCTGHRQPLNFSEYSFITAKTITRQSSHFRSGINRIDKDLTVSSSIGNICMCNISPTMNGKRMGLAAHSADQLKNISGRSSVDSLNTSKRDNCDEHMQTNNTSL